MEINIDSLISFDALHSDLEHVFTVVEKNRKVVLLKDNRPAYVILKFDEQSINLGTTSGKKKSTHFKRL